MTAIDGSVMASVRLLVKQLLADASISRETTRYGVFESDKAFECAKGNLLSEKGIGRDLIQRVLGNMPGMTKHGIGDSLSRLKTSGDYARTLAVITRQIEAEAEAVRRALGDDHQIGITLRDMSDVEIFRIMGLENSENWMNPVQHTEQVIKQGRAFFDSWLERFCTWDDFVQASESGSLAEFGATAQTAVKQMADWLGGAADQAGHGH